MNKIQKKKSILPMTSMSVFDVNIDKMNSLFKILTMVMCFRSCDSTFGFGPGSEDDLGWLSSSDVIEGSGDGLTSAFKFPCPASTALGSTSASHETSKLKETNISTNTSVTENQSLGYNGSSWSSEKNESVNLSQLSFVNESSNSECELVPDKKVYYSVSVNIVLFIFKIIFCISLPIRWLF